MGAARGARHLIEKFLLLRREHPANLLLRLAQHLAPLAPLGAHRAAAGFFIFDRGFRVFRGFVPDRVYFRFLVGGEMQRLVELLQALFAQLLPLLILRLRGGGGGGIGADRRRDGQQREGEGREDFGVRFHGDDERVP